MKLLMSFFLLIMVITPVNLLIADVDFQAPTVTNFIKVGEPPATPYTGDLVKEFPLMEIKGRKLS